MKAIDIINESIETHRQWAEYFEKNHAMENNPEYKKLGNALFHRNCIRRYNDAIAEIEQLKNACEHGLEAIKTICSACKDSAECNTCDWNESMEILVNAMSISR